MLPLVVGTETFEVADGHGLTLFADDAFALALDLLRTDPAADGGQGILAPEIADRAGHVALGEEVDESGDIDTHRTTGDTTGLLALQASRCLILGHLDGIPSRNFQKITSPDLCFLFGHRYPGILFSLIYNLGHFYLPECTRRSDVLIVENAGCSLLLR